VNYEKSVELNPDNTNGIAVLQTPLAGPHTRFVSAQPMFAGLHAVFVVPTDDTCCPKHMFVGPRTVFVRLQTVFARLQRPYVTRPKVCVTSHTTYVTLQTPSVMLQTTIVSLQTGIVSLQTAMVEGFSVGSPSDSLLDYLLSLNSLNAPLT
jgi:hypothetical protein